MPTCWSWTTERADWLVRYLAEDLGFANRIGPDSIEFLGRAFSRDVAIEALRRCVVVDSAEHGAPTWPAPGRWLQVAREGLRAQGPMTFADALAQAEDLKAGPVISPTAAMKRPNWYDRKRVDALKAAGIRPPTLYRLAWLFPLDYIEQSIAYFKREAKGAKSSPALLVSFLRTNAAGFDPEAALRSAVIGTQRATAQRRAAEETAKLKADSDTADLAAWRELQAAIAALTDDDASAAVEVAASLMAEKFGPIGSRAFARVRGELLPREALASSHLRRFAGMAIARVRRSSSRPVPLGA